MSIMAFLRELAGSPGYSTTPFPVTEAGNLIGVTSLGLLGEELARRGESYSVRSAMVKNDEAVRLDANATLPEAREALEDGDGRALVVDDGKVIGLITVAEVDRAESFARA